MPRRDPIEVRTTPASRGPAYGGSALRDVIPAPCPQAAAITAVTTKTAQGRRRRDDRIGTRRQPTDYRKVLIRQSAIAETERCDTCQKSRHQPSRQEGR